MFDRFVVVDWSAHSAPKLGRDSIWIAVRDGTGGVSAVNVATRSAAATFLAELFESDPDSTTLLGVDFSLGYPCGTAAALGLEGTAWSAMWQLLADRITDDDRNSNNRFAVAADLNRCLTGGAAPFWGCPPRAASECLTTTKPIGTATFAAFRAVEIELRAQGFRPFSSWQLLGAGAVGSQSLVGIPRLHDLCNRFRDRIEVWPFTTGFRPPRLDAGAIVVAEVWPSMLDIGSHDEVRDAAQVTSTTRWLDDTDAADGLEALFSLEMALEMSAAAVAEEGWVLGVVF